MKRLLFITLVTCLSVQMVAQPARRKTQAKEAEKKETVSSIALSERAKIQYNVTTSIPEEVVWKRDVYRTLDLEKDQNAVLYYPVEPIGEQMNLFTLLFKLLLNDEIPAYEYRLDGTELLTVENKVKVQDVLDRFGVLYEEKDGKFTVENSDIPSSEVLSYYIKESSCYDQRTATIRRVSLLFAPYFIVTMAFLSRPPSIPCFG